MTCNGMKLEKLLRAFSDAILAACEKWRLPIQLYFYLVILTEFQYNILNKLLTRPEQSRIEQYVAKYKQANPETSNRKVAIVTGANSGIGLQTAKALLAAGFHVVMACRNLDRATLTMNSIRKETGSDAVEVMELNLASITSVKKFTTEFKERHKTLDLLINNAGVMSCPPSLTEDGIELQIGTNHIGHFLLTNSLVDNLKKSRHPKIIILSSHAAYYVGRFLPDVMRGTAEYKKTQVYAVSKLCNQLFAAALARKLKKSKITVFSVHPGSIKTNLTRYLPGHETELFQRITGLILSSSKIGCLTTLRCALTPDFDTLSGAFFAKELQFKAHPVTNDVNTQEQMWQISEELLSKAGSQK